MPNSYFRDSYNTGQAVNEVNSSELRRVAANCTGPPEISEIMTSVINASAVFSEPAGRICETQVISLINARAVFLFSLIIIARPGSY